MHILFLLYLLLWFWDFTIQNLQDFIKIYRALIKDIFLHPAIPKPPPRRFPSPSPPHSSPPCTDLVDEWKREEL